MKKIPISSALLSRLSAGILQLYAPAAPDEIPKRFLGIVRGLLDCEYLCYNEFGRNHFIGVLEPDISPRLLEVFATLSDQHPSIGYVRRTKSMTAVKISDFVTGDKWRRTELYNEFFRQLAIEHQMAFMFSVADIEIGFAANRERRDFSEAHRFLLSALAPHLSQAIQNAKAVARLQRVADSAGTGGTIVFSGDGAILFCSRNAAGCVARFFGSAVTNRLPDELYRRLKEALDKPVFAGLQGRALRPFSKEGEQSCLTIRLLPNHLVNEHTLVLEEHARSLPYSVYKEFGLTSRQAEVLTWVSQGKTNPEIAIILGISVKTVGHHVEQIMSRLGVERRGGAALWAQQALRFYRGEAQSRAPI